LTAKAPAVVFQVDLSDSDCEEVVETTNTAGQRPPAPAPDPAEEPMDPDARRLAEDLRLPLRGMIHLSDGTWEVVSDASVRRSVANLLLIRYQIAVEAKIPAFELSRTGLRGEEVKACHDVFREQLEPALRERHAAGEQKRKFDLRNVCPGLQQ
jgi:hypothetical protein